MTYIFKRLSAEDLDVAMSILGGPREPDLVIAPDGNPYLYRWHVVPQNKRANTYFHIQVADDPLRPLHDHPWDNMSVILSGGYLELFTTMPGRYIGPYATSRLLRVKGDTIFRHATFAHRLLLPKGVDYAMTLFSTGPKVRQWGFWYDTGWVDGDEVCHFENGVSTHTPTHRG